MKSLQDTIYNWLTIKVVCDARPDDTAARETLDTFVKSLAEEHGIAVADIVVTKEEPFYFVTYTVNEEQKKHRYPIELIDIMLNQINQYPDKYQNYPVEE